MKKGTALLARLQILLLLFISTVGNGQVASPSTTKLTKTQGSRENDVLNSGTEDRAGNLWFGTTAEGLYRFDGKSFTQFTAKDGLTSNCIWSLLEDNLGRIWIGTGNGLMRYDGTAITEMRIFENLKSNFLIHSSLNNNALEKKEVHCMLQDKKGNIWFGTSLGVFRYDGQSFTPLIDDFGLQNAELLSMKNIQCIAEDSLGRIWFGSGPMAFEGLICYDGKSLTRYKPFGEEWFREITIDNKGIMWLASRRKGILQYDGKDFTKITLKENGTEQDRYMALSTMMDRAGNLWFSGGEKVNTYENFGGIWRFDGTNFKNFDRENGLGKYSVWFLLEDKKGSIWVGTRNTELFRLDGDTFTRFSE